MYHSFINNTICQTVAEVADAGQTDAYVIGGYVRDCLLGKSCKDIDIVTTTNGIELAHAVAQKLGVQEVHFFKNYGTAMFKYADMQVEFVGARKESYHPESRNPVVAQGSLHDDQLRRDFTINALAIGLHKEKHGQLLDPFDGISDLEKKLLRTPTDAHITFSDDPLRMLRAIRFSTRLQFAIDEQALKAIQEQAARITIVSQERITDELNKIILADKPSQGFRLLFDTGLLPSIFPEMQALHGVEVRQGKGHKDNFYHTIEVLDNVAAKSNKLWLRWAALLHDIAKPPTKRFDAVQGWTFHGHEEKGARMVKTIFKNLKLPLDHKMEYVQKLVRLHLRPIALVNEEVSDSALRRLLFEAGDDIDDLMLLCQADITSKNENKVKRYIENFELVKRKLAEVEEKDQLRNFQPPVSGEVILQTLSITPGPLVGVIKNAIKEAILEGEIGNSYDEAFAFMLEKAKALGIKPK